LERKEQIAKRKEGKVMQAVDKPQVAKLETGIIL